MNPIKGKILKKDVPHYYAGHRFQAIWERKRISAEKHQIVQCLGQGMKTLDISRKLKRDHRSVKRFVADSEHRRVFVQIKAE